MQTKKEIDIYKKGLRDGLKIGANIGASILILALLTDK